MMTAKFRRAAFALAALPLALGLAACGKEEAGTAVSGEKIAQVPPPAGKQWSDVVAKTPEGGVRMGNPEAPIKLIEFGSLTCSHCAEFSAKSEPALRETFVNSGRVSFEFRNFVRDPIDLTAALLTRCAPQESFFALTHEVMANQATMFQRVQGAGEAAYTAAMNQGEDKRAVALGQLTGLTDFFAARGLPLSQAAACLGDSAAARALADNTQKQGEEFDVQGTPTFVINGSKIQAGTWEEVKAQIEGMGAR